MNCILLCANTLHLFADELENKISIPIIHIATETAKHIKKKHLSKGGLLGTRKTMEMDFYKTKLKNENIEVIVPDKNEREFIDNTIFNELIKGIFNKKSKEKFLTIMQKLKSQGAEGIILGCTKIPLLIKQEDTDIPVFDTTRIHACAAVDFALSAK